MNRFQQRAALVPRAVTWAIALPLLAAGAYWCVSYAGLYRLLAERHHPISSELSQKETEFENDVLPCSRSKSSRCLVPFASDVVRRQQDDSKSDRRMVGELLNYRPPEIRLFV